MQHKKPLKIVITGGGTGGHIYPAIAVAQKFKEDNEKVYYMGCSKNLEKELAQQENLEFLSVTVEGMPRKINLHFIQCLLELLFSTIKAVYYFLKIKPDVVFGTGGYVSAPALIAASLLRIPFVIHDSDACPGIVSKIMSPYAKTISVSFEKAKKYLKSKNIIVNGNPLREILKKPDRQKALQVLNFSENKKTIFVMGGSQGAKTINTAILNSCQNLIKNHDLQIIHQTGKKNYEKYLTDLKEIWSEYANYKEYKIMPYVDDMAIPYSIADIVVSRSGSLSISELNLSGIPSILIPYPYAAANHQLFNAIAMEEEGASIYIEDKDCDSKTLTNKIIELLNNPEKLSLMKSNNARLAKPFATANIVQIIKNAARK